jgi:DNA-binding MarR family transcriptional regulator
MQYMVSFKKPGDDEAQAFSKAAQLIDLFRAIDPNMSSSYIAAFLAVARKPGLGPTEYAKDLGTIQPIASRILQEIGQKSRYDGREPLKLVDNQLSATSLRNKEYFLTPRGQLLYKQVLAVMEGTKRGAKK